MLRKLLKYDFLAVFRGAWLILPAMAFITVCATISANILNRLDMDMVGPAGVGAGLLFAACILVLMLCIYGIAICGVVISILLFVRFYTNFYTDEGYLTFTLPVKRSTLLLSKTLNAFLYYIAYFVLFGSCFAFFFIFGGFSHGEIKEVLMAIVGLFRSEGLWIVLYIVEGIIAILCAIFLSVSMTHFSLAFGCSIVKKAKVVCAIGIGIAVESALSIVMPSNMVSFGITYIVTAGRLSAVLGLMVYSIICFTLGLVFYNMTLDRLSRKLNVD